MFNTAYMNRISFFAVLHNSCTLYMSRQHHFFFFFLPPFFGLLPAAQSLIST